MTPEEIAEQEAATAAAKEAEAKVLAEAQAKAKAEAEAQALHKQKIEREKAEYSLKKNAERLKALGGDPSIIFEEKPDEDDGDNQPLTLGKLKELQRKEAQKTALQLAETIEDEFEKKEVKELLENRIKPSGNAEADLVLARAAANAKKNALLAEELARRGQPVRTAAGGTMPGKTEDIFEPTAEERVFMSPPYNMSKEQILAARKGAQK